MENEHSATTPAVAGDRLSQTDYKRSLAYKRLGIDPRDVQSTPFFGINLKRVARLLNRSSDKDEPHDARVCPLELLADSNDPECRKVRDAYLSVPESYRRLLPLEAFCQAAGVSPWHVLEIIVGVAARRRVQASAILAATVHPRVVQKTVERALRDDGTRERMMLHKAVGFVPTWGCKGF